jgi:energy-coupling factor transporter ATP-binding protein EcfA2
MPKNESQTEIRNFYKGFKPDWFDILDEVPALLYNTKKFFECFLVDNKASPQGLYLLFGTAGCGKTTALKQLALKVSDEGSRNVYYLDEYKERLIHLVAELDARNETPYYVFIERVGGVAQELSVLLKSSKSDKAIFVSSENIKIWTTRVKFHLDELVSNTMDVSHINDIDAEPILNKLKVFGNWTRLYKMPLRKRKIELLKKAKRQLLIGLIESTSGEGYNKIIERDFGSITCDSEKALLILAGLAATQRVPANEATLSRALSYLGQNPNVHELSKKMDGLIHYNNGNVTTRHRIYVERLFLLYVPQEQLLDVMLAYVKAFSVYDFPIVKSISKSEFTIYKHLVNSKSLKRILKNDKIRVLSIYERFEKAFENEGLFLMQYGLALRSFDENEQAYEKLRIAQQAFPESPHIEHALALQQIVLACNQPSETIAMALFSEAEIVLNRLDSASVLADVDAYDRYPIITLSEGHVKVLDNLGKVSEAKVIAKQYHDRISRRDSSESNPRLRETLIKLSKYYLSGKWKDKGEKDLQG